MDDNFLPTCQRNFASKIYGPAVSKRWRAGDKPRTSGIPSHPIGRETVICRSRMSRSAYGWREPESQLQWRQGPKVGLCRRSGRRSRGTGCTRPRSRMINRRLKTPVFHERPVPFWSSRLSGSVWEMRFQATQSVLRGGDGFYAVHGHTARCRLPLPPRLCRRFSGWALFGRQTPQAGPDRPGSALGAIAFGEAGLWPRGA